MPRRLTAAVKPPSPAKYSQKVPVTILKFLTALTLATLVVRFLSIEVRTFTLGTVPGCVGADEQVEDELSLTRGGGVLRRAESPESSASRTPFQRSSVPLRWACCVLLAFFLGAGSGFGTFRCFASSAFALFTLS